MYFGEIFRCFREWVPKMAVAVDAGTRFLNPYGITLLPLMRLRRRALRRETPSGEVYETEYTLPDPLLLPRLLRSKADVLIAIEFTPPALMAALAAALSRRKRLVLLVESDPGGRGGSSNPVVLSLKRWAVRRAGVIQTNNDKGRRYLVETLGADPAAARVAPYLTSRPPGPDARIEPHAGPLRILFANSLIPRKGLKELIEALALLDPRVRERIVLTVVGDGSERGELEAEGNALAMEDRVRFVGRRAYGELGEFYASADVLAIPSLADYRSLAGFEGLGYGLALLSSVHDGATEETVIDGVNGFAIDPRDHSMLAERITRLVERPELLTRMRTASLRLYEDKFSLAKIAANLAESVAIAAGNRVA
jgi:glycosyltransferase involved in cell wall biosynthesis